MGNPTQAMAAQCALVAEHEDETIKTTQAVQQTTTKVALAPEPEEVEPASEVVEEKDEEGKEVSNQCAKEPVADTVLEALGEENKAYDQPASGELVSETSDENSEKEVHVPTVDEILEKMDEVDMEEDAAAEEELTKDEVLNVKSGNEFKAKAAVDENEAEEKK